MKKFAVVCSVFYALSMSADLFAQTRGPRYNPPSGGGSSSGGSRSSGGSSSSGGSRSSGSSSSGPSRSSGSSSSGSSRGPSYNPPSRSSGSSSGSSSSSSSSTRGPRYNPPSSGSSSSGSSSSGSSSSGSTGPRYNPPSSGSSSSGSSSTGSVSTSPRGPRYNPPGSSTGSVGNAPRGPRYNPPVTHSPTQPPYRGPRYNNPRDYQVTVPHHYVYIRWVQYPVVYWYTDGYWMIDDYPYYVNRGYRYRYDPVDLCQYELVDAETYTTVKKYPIAACNVAYDTCAVERDTMNRTIGLERYFCAESVDDDLKPTNSTDYRGTAIEMTEAKKAAIKAYLEDMSDKDIFHDVYDNGVGNCSISKVGGILGAGNKYNCKYQANVGDKAYPAVNGSVCSDGDQAEAVGCNIGNEKENAGCIMRQAIESGYCH